MTEEIIKRQFTITTCLGRGGFGEVYRAKMSSAAGLESDVAVKVLRNDVDAAGQALERLRDEARMLARLNHPAILRVHDLVMLDGCASLVTELIEGEDLTECFGGKPPIPTKALLEAIGAVASALDAAWNAPASDGTPMRLVHRDIKPSNIRISRHGETKLLDFGIARTDAFQREARTQTNMMVGSPAYMAPERFADNEVLAESDIFSLGCSLYEGVTLQRFFGDLGLPQQTALAIDPVRFDKHLERRLAKLPKDLPAPIRQLIIDTVAYNPSERPTAKELAHRCDELLDIAPGMPIARWAKQRQWRENEPVDGPLQGRTLTEGTLTRKSFATKTTSQITRAPTEAEPRPRSRYPLAIAAGVLLFGIATATVVMALAGGLAAFSFWPQGTTVAAAPEAEVPPEEPAATDAVVDADPVAAGDAPAVVEVPPETGAKPSETTTTSPVIAAVTPKTPTVVVVPEGEKPTTTARSSAVDVAFKSTGAVTIELLRGGQDFTVPGKLEPGEYKVRASFQGGEPIILPSPITIAPGVANTVSCNERMQRCTAS